MLKNKQVHKQSYQKQHKLFNESGKNTTNQQKSEVQKRHEE